VSAAYALAVQIEIVATLAQITQRSGPAPVFVPSHGDMLAGLPVESRPHRYAPGLGSRLIRSTIR